MAPTAQFTATPAGLTVTFDGSASTDSDGTVASWAWDFGDGAHRGHRGHPDGPPLRRRWHLHGLVGRDRHDGASSPAFTQRRHGHRRRLRRGGGQLRPTVASGWGTADTGGTWTTRQAAYYSVSGGTGNITIPTAGQTATAYLNSVSTANSDITAQITLDKVGNGGGIYVSWSARRVTSPAVADYRLKLQFRPTRPVRAFLTRFSGGTETTSAS